MKRKFFKSACFFAMLIAMFISLLSYIYIFEKSSQKTEETMNEEEDMYDFDFLDPNNDTSLNIDNIMNNLGSIFDDFDNTMVSNDSMKILDVEYGAETLEDGSKEILLKIDTSIDNKINNICYYFVLSGTSYKNAVSDINEYINNIKSYDFADSDNILEN